MSRLWRPHIPLKVRCQVAERQLLANNTSLGRSVIFGLVGMKDGARLLRLRQALASTMGPMVAEVDLRLDHDPPLGARVRLTMPDGKMFYSPPANSPDHLIYREKHDHHLKTNVRGEHGQHPDRVLIKKERRRLRKGKRRRFKRKIAPRINPWPKGRRLQSRGFQRRTP